MGDREPDISKPLSYAAVGVDTAEAESSLRGLVDWVAKSLSLRAEIGAARLPIGYFANVIDIGGGLGIAISTDGVGTKVLVAQMMNKYDTVGIDCVAMNANDVLCVGAEPISLVDCLSVQEARPDLLEQIGKGLYEGARRARITIAGGELAQVREIIKGQRDGYGFDLVGTCIGIVRLDRMISGADIREGDVIVGLRSSGLHSNGYTLARRVLFDQMGYQPSQYFAALGRTLGEELLEPTRIYVPEVVEMLQAGLGIKALIHITGDGYLNLRRVRSETGFVIEQLPPPQPIFELIQQAGRIPDEEMFKVYNMGIGFCVIVPPEEVDKAIAIAGRHGVDAYCIGRAVDDAAKRIIIKAKGLVSEGNVFVRS